MEKSAMIQTRMEQRLKNKAEILLDKFGLNPTEAITLFYKQLLLQGGLPFEVALSFTERPSRLAKKSKKELIKKAKNMTPDERLGACYNHSQNLRQLKPAASL